MHWNDGESPARLEELLGTGRVGPAKELVQTFLEDVRSTARAVPVRAAEKVLDLLRAYTLFPELEETAACIAKFNPDDPRTRRQHAQALIERGRFTAAIRSLHELRELLRGWAESEDRLRRRTARGELPEVLGLLGRSYKQLYIEADPNPVELRAHDLERAVQFYRQAYEDDPGSHYWHGVNWMALLTHAERVSREDPRVLSEQAKSIAAELLVLLRDDESYWGIASRMEAHLARGETPQAIDCCRGCLEVPGLSRFELRGTLRQLQQLWLLNEESPPGDRILTPMRIRIAQLKGGGMVVDSRGELGRLAANRDELQRVWGETSYRPIEWLDAALARARAVARIGRDVHVGHGTGFLVDGSWFSRSYVGRNLLLTNAHVCSPDRQVREVYGALAPEEAVVSFLASGDRDGFRGRAVYSSPPGNLDATLLELDRIPAEVSPPFLSPLPDEGFPVAARDRVSIIGHPHGAGMQVSIQDNQVKEVGDRYLWYQTPTDPGSSGSPVFDQQWRLVGLHHASRSSKEANEGVRIDRVLESVRELGELSPASVQAGGSNPWDAAHAALARHEAREDVGALEAARAKDFAPDSIQHLEQPAQLEGRSLSSKGLDPFWPPSDDRFRFGWHLDTGFSQLRDARRRVGDPGDARIRIAILDTGFDPDHVTRPVHLRPDLGRNLTRQGGPNDSVDRTGSGLLNVKGHGTATLALLAGGMVSHPDLPGGRDWLGGAPHLEVVPVRVAESVVHFEGDAIARGIEYATEIGCRVISISMGGVPNQRWANAVNAAYERGVVIVAAAGNRFGPSPPTTMIYPARFHRVIAACGATHDKTPYFKEGLHRKMQGCFGPPGRMRSAIAAFTPNTPWAVFGQRDQIDLDGGGTSSATPQVAAAAALWLQHHVPVLPESEPWRCVEAVRFALFSAADRSVPDSSEFFGAGLLRADRALAVPFRDDLPKTPADSVRFEWLRLFLGLEATASPTDAHEALYETEALQLYLQSAEMQKRTGGADPSDETVSQPKLRAVLEAMRDSPKTSEALKRRITVLLNAARAE